MNSRYKDIFREIKKSLGRFLSILLIIAAGIGFFVGVKATAPSMYQTAENYYNQQSMMDLEILSTVGFSDEDAEKVRELDYVEKVMPSYSADLVLNSDGEMQVTKLMALPEGDNAINQPVLREGRLPQSENECVLTYSDDIESKFKIGQVLEFEEYSGDTEVSTILKQRKFTVVGIVNLPQYISYSFGTSSIGNGSVTLVMLIPQSNFVYSRYTEMYLTLNCHDQNNSAFDEDYDSVVKSVTSELEKLGELQYKIFLDDTERQLKEAEGEYYEGREEAKKELDDALTKLNDAKSEIENGILELEKGWKEYEAGSQEAQRQIQNAEIQIADLKRLVAEGERELLNAQADYENAKRYADDALRDARKELDSGWEEYNENLNKYNSFKDLYQQYLDANEQYNTALTAYSQALSIYNNTLATISALEERLAEYELEETEVTESDIALTREALYYFESQLALYEEMLASQSTGSEEYEMLSRMVNFFQDEIPYYEGLVSEIEQTGVINKQNVQIILSHTRESLGVVGTELDTAQAELAEAGAQINAIEEEYGEELKQMETAEADLAAAYAQLQDYEKEYAAQKAEADRELADARAELEKGRRELDDANIQIANGEAELNRQKQKAGIELQEGYNQLTSSENELNEAQKEYEEGLKEYNKAVEEVENELSKGMNRIQNARKDFNDIVAGKWYVLSRDDSVVNYKNFKMDAERISAIADVFPVFFLLVAALVCLTTMSRMIDEQRIQLGTYKALGYRPREIIAKYVIYAAIACICGCILGPIICVQILPRVIFGAYTLMYKLPNFVITMPIDMLIVSVIVALICTVLVAWIACWKELRATTASLMRPKAPKAGKKILLENIPWLWNRFSFFQKLTTRNLFRYKVRLLMTVIGIAGCMALVVAGFSLRNAITPIVHIQYTDLSHDDIDIYLDQSYEYDEIREFMDVLNKDERIADAKSIYQTECSSYNINETVSMEDTYLVTPQDANYFGTMLTIRDPRTHKNLSWSDEGVIINEKLSRMFDANAGDEIVIKVDEQKYKVRVAGVTECYMYNYVYFTPNYYKQIFGKSPKVNMVNVTESEKMTDRDAFATEFLSQYDQVIMTFFTDEAEGTLGDMMASMNLVVIVMILCAGVLAFIVLYNLTNINLSERLREIATVKVLGFNHKETNMYIFRENMILCILGILLGSVLGYLMSQYLISTVEVSMVTFIRAINWTSYLFSAGITLLFTVLVNLFMTKRIKAISMVESLKAIE